VETLLGISTDAIMLGSLAGVGLAIGLLLVAGLRRPLLFRLALRNPWRRPTQSLLITLGLALGTIVVGTAFNTGDTITHAVRSLVASGVGRADEVVLALPRDQRRPPAEYVAALLNGTLLTGAGGYFPEEQAVRLIAATADDQRIAGVTPAIGERATVINRDRHSVQGEVSLLALPTDYPPVFGGLAVVDGMNHTAATLGGRSPLAELASDEVLANTAAAVQLDVQPGTLLEARTRDGSFPLRVRGTVQSGELGGPQATIYLPLAAYQTLAGREGRVNQILVANRGDATTSVRLSREVARSLRAALADRGAARALFDLLRTDTVQAQIASLARTADGRQRQKLEWLIQSLSHTEPSEDFISLVTDPDVERRLFPAVARQAAASAGVSGLREISPLRVLEVKQASQDQADRWGGALTSIFLVLGLFSLATGLLLVFLIFTTLAAERRSELGVMRALGTRRRELVMTFMLEGAAYDVVASAIGVGAGVLFTLAMTAAADASLSQYGVRLQPHIEPRSLVVAFCLGVLLTLLSVGYSAWHVSHLSIVTAIRDLPEPRGRKGRLWSAVTPIGLVGLGTGVACFGLRENLPLAQAAGVLSIAIGLAHIGRALLGRMRVGYGVSTRLAYSWSGVALVAYWLLPSDIPLLASARPAPRGVDLFFLAGLSIVLGAVWVLMYNLSGLTGWLVATAARFRGVGLALRTAVANPLEHRFRTGLIVAMFAVVIMNMVVASVLLTATHRAYSDPEAVAGGFDVRAELDRPAELPNLMAALDGATAVRPEDVSAIGRQATRPGQVLELGPGARRWRSYSLQEVDRGFVDGLRSPLAARAEGFPSDTEVWEALQNQPGFAVVAGPAVGPRETDASLSTTFRFGNLFQDQSRFKATDVWVRDERAGRATKLTVIGVLDPRASFGAGLYSSRATFEAAGVGPPQRITHFLRTGPGAEPRSLALGLNVSLGDKGLRAAPIGEEIRRIESVRALVNELLQGFFAVGLLAGLAALGVISMRAVVERRQQVGLLRALGFSRQTARLSLLLETSLVAVLGVGLGVGLGLGLARRLVDHLGRQYPEIVFSVPWQQISAIAAGAYLAGLLLAALPVWQIGRIQPAEGLRYQ
jgi:putative ABC transport system permease protein